MTKTIRNGLDNSKDLKRRTTLSFRMAIAMASLVLLSVLAVGGLTFWNVRAAILPRVDLRIGLELRLLKTQLGAYVRGAREDVVGIHGAAAIQGIMRARLAGGIDPLDNVPEDTWRQRLAERFATELAAKPSYDKISTGRL